MLVLMRRFLFGICLFGLLTTAVHAAPIDSPGPSVLPPSIYGCPISNNDMAELVVPGWNCGMATTITFTNAYNLERANVTTGMLIGPDPWQDVGPLTWTFELTPFLNPIHYETDGTNLFAYTESQTYALVKVGENDPFSTPMFIQADLYLAGLEDPYAAAPEPGTFALLLPLPLILWAARKRWLRSQA